MSKELEYKKKQDEQQKRFYGEEEKKKIREIAFNREQTMLESTKVLFQPRTPQVIPEDSETEIKTSAPEATLQKEAEPQSKRERKMNRRQNRVHDMAEGLLRRTQDKTADSKTGDLKSEKKILEQKLKLISETADLKLEQARRKKELNSERKLQIKYEAAVARANAYMLAALNTQGEDGALQGNTYYKKFNKEVAVIERLKSRNPGLDQYVLPETEYKAAKEAEEQKEEERKEEEQKEEEQKIIEDRIEDQLEAEKQEEEKEEEKASQAEELQVAQMKEAIKAHNDVCDQFDEQVKNTKKASAFWRTQKNPFRAFASWIAPDGEFTQENNALKTMVYTKSIIEEYRAAIEEGTTVNVNSGISFKTIAVEIYNGVYTRAASIYKENKITRDKLSEDYICSHVAEMKAICEQLRELEAIREEQLKCLEWACEKDKAKADSIRRAFQRGEERNEEYQKLVLGISGPLNAWVDAVCTKKGIDLYSTTDGSFESEEVYRERLEKAKQIGDAEYDALCQKLIESGHIDLQEEEREAESKQREEARKKREEERKKKQAEEEQREAERIRQFEEDRQKNKDRERELHRQREAERKRNGTLTKKEVEQLIDYSAYQKEFRKASKGLRETACEEGSSLSDLNKALEVCEELLSASVLADNLEDCIERAFDLEGVYMDVIECCQVYINDAQTQKGDRSLALANTVLEGYKTELKILQYGRMMIPIRYHASDLGNMSWDEYLKNLPVAVDEKKHIDQEGRSFIVRKEEKFSELNDADQEVARKAGIEEEKDDDDDDMSFLARSIAAYYVAHQFDMAAYYCEPTLLLTRDGNGKMTLLAGQYKPEGFEEKWKQMDDEAMDAYRASCDTGKNDEENGEIVRQTAMCNVINMMIGNCSPFRENHLVKYTDERDKDDYLTKRTITDFVIANYEMSFGNMSNDDMKKLDEHPAKQEDYHLLLDNQQREALGKGAEDLLENVETDLAGVISEKALEPFKDRVRGVMEALRIPLQQEQK